MTNLTIRINNTTIDSSFLLQPTFYKTVNPANDYFLFSAGSSVVADGFPIPSATDINRAATALGVTAIEVAKYFLASNGDNVLYQIKNAGSVNKQHVICCSFDGETASEPQLEAWDDSDMITHTLDCLGGTTPNNSYYRAICTTASLPGAGWNGIPLSGDGVSNVLQLNNGSGPISIATDLYFNFKVLIPGGLSTPQSYQPVLAIVYTTN